MNQNEKEALARLADAISGALTTFAEEIKTGVTIKPHKRTPGTINKLEPELREKVVLMLRSERYTYDEIVSFLCEHGIKTSVPALSRFRKEII